MIIELDWTGRPRGLFSSILTSGSEAPVLSRDCQFVHSNSHGEEDPPPRILWERQKRVKVANIVHKVHHTALHSSAQDHIYIYHIITMHSCRSLR